MGAFSGALGSLWVEVGAKISKFESAMQQVSNEVNTTVADVQKQFSGFDKLGDHMRGIGVSMLPLTGIITGIGVASTNMAQDFQGAMNRVSALGEITGKDLKALEDQAVQLGAKTKFSATEAAQGMAELAATGQNTQQIMATLPAVMDLAAAGQISIAQAAVIATDAISQFSLKVTDSAHVADVLAKAAASGKDSVQGLGVALSYVGEPANAAGVSLEQTAAALTLLAEGGLRGERAGTALRNILISLANPTDQAAKLLEQMGVKLVDAGGKMLPLSTIIDDLAKRNLGLGEAAKLVGEQGATGLLKLAKLGGSALETMAGSFVNADGAVKQMAGTLEKGLPGALEKAKGSIETAGITLGQALAPTIVKIAQLVEDAANKIAAFGQWFQTLPEPVQNTAIAITALAAAIGPALIVAGTLVASITSLYTGFGLLAGAGGIVGIATKAITGLGAAFTVANLATVAYTAGIGAAAVALGITAKAAYDYAQSKKDLKEADEGATKALKVLEVHLRQQGADLSNLQSDLKRGIITQKDYEKGLRQIAVAMGDQRKAAGLVVTETKKVSKEQDAGEKIAKQLSAAMKQQQDSLKGASQEMAVLGKETPRVTQQSEVLLAIQQQLNAEHNRSVQAVARHTIELQKLGDMTAVLEAATAEFKGELGTIPGQLQNISAMADPFGKDIANAIGFGVPAVEQLGAAIEETVTETTAVVDTGLAQTKGAWDTWGKQVSTIVTDLGKDLGRILFDGDKSWAEKGKAALSALGQAVTRTFVEPATAAITDFIGGVLADLIGGKGFGGLVDSVKSAGKAIADVFGGLGSGAGQAASQVGGAAGQVGGSAGGAGSAAGSAAGGGISSIVGAIGSIGGLVTGIIGNFQNARQENTLNAIEESIRYMKIWTGEREWSIMQNTGKAREYLGYITATTDGIGKKLDEWLEPSKNSLQQIAEAIPLAQTRLDEISHNTSWGSAADRDNTSVLHTLRELLGADRTPQITVYVNGVQQPASAVSLKLQGVLV